MKQLNCGLEDSKIFNNYSEFKNLTYILFFYVLGLSILKISFLGIIYSLFIIFIVYIFYKRYIYDFYIVTFFITEFYYINIGGGILRPYHFLTFLFIPFILKNLKILIASKGIRIVCLFFTLSFMSTLLSDNLILGLKSLVLPIINFLIAINLYLFLKTEKITLKHLMKLQVYIFFICLMFGYLQFIAFKLLKVNLALSKQQLPQIFLGLIPSFRTESNTFGKFTAIFFPLIIILSNNKKNLKIQKLLIAGLIMLILNFTRSVMYPLFLIIPILFKTMKIRLYKYLKILISISFIVMIFIVLKNLNILNISEYGLYKISSFLDFEKISSDGSVSYRLDSINISLNNFLQSKKTILFGNGWGQSYGKLQGQIVQVGGNDFISILSFNGIIGFLVYIYMILFFLIKNFKLMRNSKIIDLKIFSIEVYYSFLILILISMSSGTLISPEYWYIFGCLIFISDYKK